MNQDLKIYQCCTELASTQKTDRARLHAPRSLAYYYHSHYYYFIIIIIIIIITIIIIILILIK